MFLYAVHLFLIRSLFIQSGVATLEIMIVSISLVWMYRDWETDRKSTRLNSSHSGESRMPSSA